MKILMTTFDSVSIYLRVLRDYFTPAWSLSNNMGASSDTNYHHKWIDLAVFKTKSDSCFMFMKPSSCLVSLPSIVCLHSFDGAITATSCCNHFNRNMILVPIMPCFSSTWLCIFFNSGQIGNVWLGGSDLDVGTEDEGYDDDDEPVLNTLTIAVIASVMAVCVTGLIMINVVSYKPGCMK